MPVTVPSDRKELRRIVDQLDRKRGDVEALTEQRDDLVRRLVAASVLSQADVARELRVSRERARVICNGGRASS